MYKLTVLSEAAKATDTGKAIATLDGVMDDGLAKEIVVRLAAVAVLKPEVVLTVVAETIENLVVSGAQPLAKIVTMYLNDTGLILIPDGADAPDAVIAVHGVIQDVIATEKGEKKPLMVETIPPTVPVIAPGDTAGPTPVEKKKAKFGAVKPSIAGANVAAAKSATDTGDIDKAALLASVEPMTLDVFLDDAHEPMRPMVTRTVAHFYPELFKAYRAIKDQGTPESKREAYGLIFSAYRKMIGTDAADAAK